MRRFRPPDPKWVDPSRDHPAAESAAAVEREASLMAAERALLGDPVEDESIAAEAPEPAATPPAPSGAAQAAGPARSRSVADLLQRAGAGDPEALHEIERRFGQRLRSMMTRMLVEPERIEPLLAAALAEAVAHADEIDRAREEAEDWLFGRVRYHVWAGTGSHGPQPPRSRPTPPAAGSPPATGATAAEPPPEPPAPAPEPVAPAKPEPPAPPAPAPTATASPTVLLPEQTPPSAAMRPGHAPPVPLPSPPAPARDPVAAHAGPEPVETPPVSPARPTPSGPEPPPLALETTSLPTGEGGPLAMAHLPRAWSWWRRVLFLMLLALLGMGLGAAVVSAVMIFGGTHSLPLFLQEPMPPLVGTPPAAPAAAPSARTGSRITALPTPPLPPAGVPSPAEPAASATASPAAGSAPPAPSMDDGSDLPPPAVTSEPTDAAAAAGAQPAGSIRLFIHYTRSPRTAATAEDLAERLRRTGFTVAAIRPVPFRIGNGGVRYFFPQDRSESRRLLDVVSRLPDIDAGIGPRSLADFTHYSPKPAPGTVELWLPTQP